MTQDLTGLFLGAGASYELGMPLVWELTDELRTVLIPEKLRRFNAGWRAQGGGHPDSEIEDLASVGTRSDMHYENVLGYIETQFQRASDNAIRQEYHGLYGWLCDMVYHILWYRHVRNAEYIRQNICHLRGMKHFIGRADPLWVFSLNHDLIVECLAADLGVPVNSGFGSETVLLPCHDSGGRRVGELRAAVVTADDLKKSSLKFFHHGEAGINLIKIHGGLDVFAFREGHDFLKLIPEDQSVAGVLATLGRANTDLRWVHPVTKRQAKATNEIAFTDEKGEMQFLRRSLLAGAYKFDEHRQQVLPRQFLEMFRANINWVTKLVCIGYSFGDVHINSIIREWLQRVSDRRIEIVDPGVGGVPGFLSHLAPQVVLKKMGATDYFDGVSGIVHGRRETLVKRLARWSRKQPRPDGLAKFQTFMRDAMGAAARTAVETIVALPRAGDSIDPAALGGTPEEFARRLVQDLGVDPDDLLEKFLDAQDGKAA
jgi:hypothetical protein